MCSISAHIPKSGRSIIKSNFMLSLQYKLTSTLLVNFLTGNAELSGIGIVHASIRFIT